MATPVPTEYPIPSHPSSTPVGHRLTKIPNTNFPKTQPILNPHLQFAIQRHTLWYLRAVVTVRIFEDGLHIWEAFFKLELFVYHNTSGDTVCFFTQSNSKESQNSLRIADVSRVTFLAGLFLLWRALRRADIQTLLVSNLNPPLLLSIGVRAHAALNNSTCPLDFQPC